MQGERFNPSSEPVNSPLRSIQLSATFGIGGDTHSVLALTSIMNAFPRAVAVNGVPLPIKCDIFKSRADRRDIAYATRRDQCYWILFCDKFIEACASNAELFAKSIKALEPSLFRDVREEHLLALVRDLTMEIVVQHELCHVKQGHVDYALQSGPLGVAESTVKPRLADQLSFVTERLKFRQRSMEFVADEAGIGAATLGAGTGRWILADQEAKKHFDTSTIALAAYIGMLAFTIEVSDIDSKDGYPSKAARTLHFHTMFSEYVHAGISNPALRFNVNPTALVERAHLCLDVLNEAADRGRFGHRSSNFKAAVAGLFSEQAHAQAQRECDEIANECRQDMPNWAPFHGQYVAWQEYVAYERRNGRNPTGVAWP